MIRESLVELIALLAENLSGDPRGNWSEAAHSAMLRARRALNEHSHPAGRWVESHLTAKAQEEIPTAVVFRIVPEDAGEVRYVLEDAPQIAEGEIYLGGTFGLAVQAIRGIRRAAVARRAGTVPDAAVEA